MSDLCEQALLRRHRVVWSADRFQLIGGDLHLAGNFRVHLLRSFQFVPQAVDLVQHHQTALGAALHRGDMVAPDFDIGFGHASVGGQQEQHGVGVGQQAQGELRLGADGIQARRVENDQTLFQQRMGIDQRVAPTRNLQRTFPVQTAAGFLVIWVGSPYCLAIFSVT